MNKIIIEKELCKNAQFFLNTDTGNDYKSKALDFFQSHGLPTTIAAHISPRFVQHKETMNSNPSAEVINSRAVILFVNGFFDSDNSVLPNGIEIKSEQVDSSNLFLDSYDALNAVAAVSPLSLLIKKNTVLDFPITILHTVTEAGVNKIVSPRILVTLEENTKVDFLEFFTSIQPEIFQYTTNAFTAFILGHNAKVEHIKFSNEATNSLHLGWTTAHLAKDASFFSTVIAPGQLLAAHHLQINLNQSGAETSANSLFTLKRNERNNIFTTINHHASHTHSTQLCKGVLNDESFGIFNGNIVVALDAQEITSSQLNKNLLLSKKAHIDTRPQLLVSADDVKCSHGATVGQLSDDEAFYLESRGIKKERAKEMLMEGFSKEIINLIKNKTIRQFCESKLKK
jgi:Fe-S cluster assembly protein SufD